MDVVTPFVDGAVVATGSATAGYCLRNAVELYQMRKFYRAFGFGVRKPEDLMISVPLWRAIEGNRSTPRFLKADSFGTREERYGPSAMYNEDDMVAAVYILNIIGNHFSEPVTYTNDAAKADWNAKTVVIVGAPTANYHARYYMQKFVMSNSNVRLPCFVDIEEDDVTGARCAIKIPDSPTPMRSNAHKDFGLILRMPNMFSADGRFFVFLIAGIHAPSTREAARLLNEHWTECFQRRKAVGIVFEMDPNLEGTGRIVYQTR